MPAAPAMGPIMIESFVPGRVRLRSRLLRDPETAGVLRRSLLDIRGVRSVSLNERTGGLLLEYDAGSLPLPVLMVAPMSELCVPPPECPKVKMLLSLPGRADAL